MLAGLPLRGRHNLDNLCGAICATRLLTGICPTSVCSRIRSRRWQRSRAGSPRSRPPAESSSSTTPWRATLLARSPHSRLSKGGASSLIAGGHDRGASLSDVARTLDAMDNAALVHLGDAGDRLAVELGSIGSKVRCLPANDAREAVELAVGALDGAQGVVLLSPAAPTPASEGTYVARSEQFRVAVEQYSRSEC